MGLKTLVSQLYLTQIRTLRRPGVVGELVNAASPNLFTITGGDIMVVGIHGKITTAFGTTATTLQLRLTTALAGTVSVLGLACTTLSDQVADILLTSTGAVGVALAISAAAGVGVYAVTNAQVLVPGGIDVLVGGATSTVAAVEWTINYIPLHPAANVALA